MEFERSRVFSLDFTLCFPQLLYLGEFQQFFRFYAVDFCDAAQQFRRGDLSSRLDLRDVSGTLANSLCEGANGVTSPFPELPKP